MWRWTSVLHNKNSRERVKEKPYKTVVTTELLYGSKTVEATSGEKNRNNGNKNDLVDAWQTRRDKIRNEILKEKLKSLNF